MKHSGKNEIPIFFFSKKERNSVFQHFLYTTFSKNTKFSVPTLSTYYFSEKYEIGCMDLLHLLLFDIFACEMSI